MTFETFWAMFKGPGTYLPSHTGTIPNIEQIIESVARKCWEQGSHDGTYTERERVVNVCKDGLVERSGDYADALYDLIRVLTEEPKTTTNE